MARPVIALLTDFGLRDHYVGTMKGVALGICPEATFVDISHDLPPQDILTAAVELDASYKYFPPGTIFLVVVDPGVGSARRGVAVDTGVYRFVGPDNGVFSLVIERHVPTAAVELTDPRYARPSISRTFEGRDRFAPAAAWLATGVPVTALGVPAGSLVRVEIPALRHAVDSATGVVLRVDRFGNLITNIDPVSVERLGAAAVEIAGRRIAQIVGTYAEVPDRTLCALVGSSGHLEVAVNGGSAAEALGAGRGTIVQVRRTV